MARDIKICYAYVVQRIISCGNTGQVEKQSSAGLRALSLPSRVWSLLKAHSSRSLLTIVQAVSNILFVHVSAAWTFSHTHTFSACSFCYLTGRWQARCNYSHPPASGGFFYFVILWLEDSVWWLGPRCLLEPVGWRLWLALPLCWPKVSRGMMETFLLLYSKKLNPFHWP